MTPKEVTEEALTELSKVIIRLAKADRLLKQVVTVFGDDHYDAACNCTLCEIRRFLKKESK